MDIVELQGLETPTSGPRVKVRQEAARGVRRCGRTVTPEQLSEIEARHAAGASRRELAEVAGCSVGMFAEMLNYGCLSHLPRRQGHGGGRPRGFNPALDNDGPMPGDPSPREIRRLCREIRSTWGPDDARARDDRMDPRPTTWSDSIRTSNIRICPTPAGVHLD